LDRQCHDGSRKKKVTVAEHDWLLDRFEARRAHLRAVAYRMLGSTGEADDAVQEAWVRLTRSDTSAIENLDGWLTTVVSRVSLDMLRSRASRREEPAGESLPEHLESPTAGSDPEHEALLADTVGSALLVVLDTLSPAERLAFVLHDMFAVPFDEIAPIVGRSPDAARQLASRARRRVRGADTSNEPDHTRQREVVDAFLAAARDGDFDALVAVLDPDVVLRSDRAALPAGVPREVHGAPAVARRALVGRARAARPALVDGAVGVVVAPRGRLLMVLDFKIRDGKIVEIDAVADPERLNQLALALLDG
jgi:RNA polymerase sigma factor (sigma-70 family)